MNVNDSRIADYLAAIDTELELFDGRWPAASYQGDNMHRSHFFHRDEADAFYTDRYEDDAPAIECPYCDLAMDVLSDNTHICPDCQVPFPSAVAVELERATVLAAPFHEDALLDAHYGYGAGRTQGM